MEIRQTERILDSLLARAELVDLWAAAYVINGGCSDDSFQDFRGWLVTQGREAFERVVADPDALSDLPVVRCAIEEGEDLFCESMVFPAWAAWERVTGEDCPPEPDNAVDPGTRPARASRFAGGSPARRVAPARARARARARAVRSETYVELAHVLATGDATSYQPAREPNTHRSNWPESGSL